jgi:hypothetical protein
MLGPHPPVEPRRSSVTGLVPRAVRFEVSEPQAQLLINELVTTIEAKAGSLREDHDRHGRLSHATISDMSEWLVEYRNVLDGLCLARETHRTSDVTIVTASTVAADRLVRACATRSVELLGSLLQERGGKIEQLRVAGAAAAAWATTLADLRELDEDAPDYILE